MADPETPAVRCELCPRACLIRQGGFGACRIRTHAKGAIHSVVYGRPCSVQVDPIEKKPFFHFLPGTQVFSIGAPGCNLRCRNCQNWEISQGNPRDLPFYDLPPAEVPLEAARRNCPSVAYTYTEPLIDIEYTQDCARECRRAGLRNVVVTAGYINPGPLRGLCRWIDAVTLDIKALSDRFYRDVCDASLEPVLRSIEVLCEERVFLELSNLVIPTLNDSDENLRDLCRWVAQHPGPETPFHFLGFHPMHHMKGLPPTPVATLVRAREIARAEGLRHVYIGNREAPGGEDTVCASCGRTLIRRNRFQVTENRLRNGACPDCGKTVPGVW